MLTRFRKGVLRAIVALFSVVVSVSADALTFPELTGRVVDDAGILDPATNAALAQACRFRDQDHGPASCSYA